MFQYAQRFREHPVPPAFVLDEHTKEDVARAMIENGQQTEPFYIFDMDETYRNIQKFRRSMPRLQVFYAMKANDSEMMLKLAIAMGLGFDCASPGEINRIIRLSVNPTSIIYAAPAKTPEQMIYARKAGVKHITFDTACELDKIKQYWPDVHLLIRIKVESDSVYKLADKYGCQFETEAVNLLEEAASLGLTVCGVAHFHVGSACFSIESYVVGIQRARALFDHEAKAGRHMKILDIGGGFLEEQTQKFEKVARLVSESLAHLFPEPSVQIIAESAFTLYCNISNVKTLKRNNRPLHMVYINDGVHGTLRFVEPWHKVHKFHHCEENEDNLEDTILCGPTPSSRDRMTVQLPRCSPQDWLVFEMQESYSFVFSGRFAGQEIALIRPVISKSVWAHIKDKSIFKLGDFIVSPNIAAPLPSTLPPLAPYTGCPEYSQSSVLAN